MSKPLTVMATINTGTVIHQDFSAYRWPACALTKAQLDKYEHTNEYVNTVFDCNPTRNGGWECSAVGFGKQPEYGNGSIFTHDATGITILPDQPGEKKVDSLYAKDTYTFQILNKSTNILQLSKMVHAGKDYRLVLGYYQVLRDRAFQMECTDETTKAITHVLEDDPIGTIHVRYEQDVPVIVYRNAAGYWLKTVSLPIAVRLHVSHNEPDEDDAVDLKPLAGTNDVMRSILNTTFLGKYVPII